MKTVGRNRQLIVNIASAVMAFAVNMGISFFLTPYIVAHLGIEANGFLGLANNFVSYASLLTIALNSMAGRFITLKICDNDMEEANKYFNSVLLANIVLSIIVFFVSAICIFRIEYMISIPQNLLLDVKLTLIISFSNFIISIMTSVFSISFFATNKLYISSMRGIQSNILRAVIIIIGFLFFKPMIVYVTLGAMASSIFVLIFDVYYSKKLLPEIKINRKMFDFEKVKELFASGIWNTITKLSQIFTSGLDLLVSNIFINATAMGVLTVAKTVPTVIINLFCSVSSVFSPEMTILYGQNKNDELKRSIKQAIRLLCVFVSIPIAILIAYGSEFYSLWQPTQNAELLQKLSILTVINSCITGPIQPLYQVFTITNRVKESAKVMIGYGFLSILTTILVLKFSDLGLYAIVLISMIGSVLIALCFHIPRSAVLLGMKWYTFYSDVLLNVISCIIITAIGYFVKNIIVVHSWFTLFISGGIAGLFGLIIEWFILLRKDERKLITQKLRGK